MASLTALEVAGKACVLARIRKINAFTENTVEAIVLNENYEDIVRNEIMEYSYKFAKKQWTLVRKVAAPLARWDAAYTLPDDMVSIDTVLVNNEPIPYDQYVGEIYCDAGENDTVILDGTQRLDESLWPTNFVHLIKFRLAEILADGVAQKPTMATRFADKANELFLRAKVRNSQSVTNKKIRVKRIVNNRNGSRYRT